MLRSLILLSKYKVPVPAGLHTATAQSGLTQVTEDNSGVRRIVLNNPKKRNALSLAMMEALKVGLTQDLESLRCIVLSATGPVFSSGHDLKELLPETGRQQHEKIFSFCSQLMLTLQQIPVPVIAQVNGLAAAAGCQLVASCDLAICTDQSTFSTPGVNFGLFCSTPGIALARAVPRKMAAYMLLTGRPISAQEALRCGLVSHVVPENQLQDLTNQLVQDILNKSRTVVAMGKEFFYHQIQHPVESAYQDGTQAMVNNLGLTDCGTGLKAFFEKKAPQWSHKN